MGLVFRQTPLEPGEIQSVLLCAQHFCWRSDDDVLWSVMLCRLMSMPQLSIQLGTGPRHCSWCFPRRTRVCSQDRGQRCGGLYSAPCQTDRCGRIPKEGGKASSEWLGCGEEWMAAIGECQSVRFCELCLGNGCDRTQAIRGSTQVHSARWIKREVCNACITVIMCPLYTLNSYYCILNSELCNLNMLCWVLTGFWDWLLQVKLFYYIAQFRIFIFIVYIVSCSVPHCCLPVATIITC